MTTGEYIGGLLHAATIAHVLHLRTNSHPQHLALNELYAGLPELVDQLAEAYQGHAGADVAGYPRSFAMPSREEPLTWLEGVAKTARDQRAVMGSATEVQNLVDEVLGFFDGILNKLRKYK